MKCQASHNMWTGKTVLLLYTPFISLVLALKFLLSCRYQKHAVTLPSLSNMHTSCAHRHGNTEIYTLRCQYCNLAVNSVISSRLSHMLQGWHRLPSSFHGPPAEQARAIGLLAQVSHLSYYANIVLSAVQRQVYIALEPEKKRQYTKRKLLALRKYAQVLVQF